MAVTASRVRLLKGIINFDDGTCVAFIRRADRRRPEAAIAHLARVSEADLSTLFAEQVDGTGERFEVGRN
jgi:hypothetical protein